MRVSPNFWFAAEDISRALPQGWTVARLYVWRKCTSALSAQPLNAGVDENMGRDRMRTMTKRQSRRTPCLKARAE